MLYNLHCLYMFLLGGTLTMDDLRSFQVRVADAWTVPIGNAQMHIPPPPAGGALLAFIVSLMEGLIYWSDYWSVMETEWNTNSGHKRKS